MDSPNHSDPDFLPKPFPVDVDGFSEELDVDDNIILEDENLDDVIDSQAVDIIEEVTTREEDSNVTAVPTSRINSPEEINLSIYDAASKKELYMDMKKNHPPN